MAIGIRLYSRNRQIANPTMYNAENERESSINILYNTCDNEIMIIMGWLYEQTK